MFASELSGSKVVAPLVREEGAVGRRRWSSDLFRFGLRIPDTYPWVLGMI